MVPRNSTPKSGRYLKLVWVELEMVFRILIQSNLDTQKLKWYNSVWCRLLTDLIISKAQCKKLPLICLASHKYASDNYFSLDQIYYIWILQPHTNLFVRLCILQKATAYSSFILSMGRIWQNMNKYRENLWFNPGFNFYLIIFIPEEIYMVGWVGFHLTKPGWTSLVSHKGIKQKTKHIRTNSSAQI